ncbi:hypothetical protein PYCC9005_005740 [Savitreella phatthalungensis]
MKRSLFTAANAGRTLPRIHVRTNLATRTTGCELTSRRAYASKAIDPASSSTTTASSATTSEKKAPFIHRFLHGNQEAQEEIEAAVQERETNFSQKIARGKYVHEFMVHSVKPECVKKYLDLIRVAYPRIAENPLHEVHHVCSMQHFVGSAFTFTHIWEYKGYAGYDRTMEIARKSEDYLSFRGELEPLLLSQHTSLNQEFAFWNTIPPQTLGGIFEKRTYTVVPGKLLEWEKHWQQGLQARRQVMTPVGAWFSQLGELNTVTHIWQFDSFADRKAARDKCWEIDGWADTVHKTVPLVVKMKAEIMKACDFSPIR